MLLLTARGDQIGLDLGVSSVTTLALLIWINVETDCNIFVRFGFFTDAGSGAMAMCDSSNPCNAANEICYKPDTDSESTCKLMIICIMEEIYCKTWR